MRFLPIVVTVVVFLLVGALPIARHRLRYGGSPIASIGLIRWSLRLLVLALFLQTVAFSVWPAAMARLDLVQPWWRTALAVIAVGVTIIMRAQWEMGASWRIGIEGGAKPGLVTNGLFAWSRNPIYLGILVIVAGYTLAMPTLLSAVCLIGCCLGLSHVVRTEERYLTETYGAEFSEYAARVGRFLPGVG